MTANFKMALQYTMKMRPILYLDLLRRGYSTQM